MILCGQGKALSPFSRVRSTGTPKALLPVANRPMLDYVLEWCEKAFFPRVTVVSDEDSKAEIEASVGGYKLRLSFGGKSAIAIAILGANVESSGAILLQLKQHLQPNSEFVILPCDFVTNLPPQVLIEAYRCKAESDLGLLVHYKNQLDIEDKKNKIFPANYTVYNDDDGQLQLLDIYTKEDVEFHKSIPIRTQMVWRYPRFTVSTKLLNPSIFFGSHDIFKVFEENPSKFNESYFNHRSLLKVIRDLARRSWKHSKNLQTVGFFVSPHQATFFRSNNTNTLLEANRYFMRNQAIEIGQLQGQQPPKDKTAANVGIDSLIGENTQLGEKTNVKRTVVGSNCVIGKRVKLTGSLILDNVTIEDDVQLENCIIGNGVIIHSKSKLVSTNVESTHEIPRGTITKNETLLCLSLEGIVEGEESALESSSEDSDEETDSDFDDDYDDEYVGNDDGLFDY